MELRRFGVKSDLTKQRAIPPTSTQRLWDATHTHHCRQNLWKITFLSERHLLDLSIFTFLHELLPEEEIHTILKA